MTLPELQQHLSDSPTGAIVFGKLGAGRQDWRYFTRGEYAPKLPSDRSSTPRIIYYRLGSTLPEDTTLSRLVFDRYATAEEAALLEEIAA